MQESKSRILGIPGVALLDNTSEPAFRNTVLLKPDSLICSAICKIKGEFNAVTSDILSQR